jgi:hypothetical protein
MEIGVFMNTPKIQIDGKEVVYSTSLLIKNEQIAYLEVPVKDDLLKLSLVFKDPKATDKLEGSWNYADGVVNFIFTGWDNSLGSCVLEPTKFGDLSNKKLYFQISHHYVAEFNSVNLYIYLGD